MNWYLLTALASLGVLTAIALHAHGDGDDDVHPAIEQYSNRVYIARDDEREEDDD